jgi:DNA-binding NarL/FixJ family response regulator
MRILLADDHSMFRAGLRRIIEDCRPGVCIVEAASCDECLQIARAGKLDLIILDVSMHSQNSLGILPEIKNCQPHTPIMMLSMHADTEFVVQALRAGASGYLTKEHTAEELIRAIDTALSGQRYVSSSLAENLVDLIAGGTSDKPHEALSAGKSLSEIARLLSLSTKTVSTYRTRILEKMALGSNAELMRYALRNKLVD